MGAIGLGIGFTFAAMPGLIVAAVPRQETGSAMGFYQVSRFIGFSLGSGLCVSLLRAFGTHGVPTISAYRSTAWVVVGLGIFTAVIAWVLQRRAHVQQPALTPAAEAQAVEEGLVASAGLEMLETDLASS
jgi:MFS family permease